MRLTWIVLLLFSLLLFSGPVAAQVPPRLEGLDVLWWGEDAANDTPPSSQPQPMPPGGDLHYLALAVNGTDLLWYVGFYNITQATGDYFYQVFWTEADSEGQVRSDWDYVTAAEVTWAGGQMARVAKSERGGDRIGTPSWDAQRELLVFRVTANERGVPDSAVVSPTMVLSGATLGPSGIAGMWDEYFPTNATIMLAQPAPAPSQGSSTTSTRTADALSGTAFLAFAVLTVWRRRVAD